MKNVLYLLGGIVIGVLLTIAAQWIAPNLRFERVIECPDPLPKIQFIDTCMTTPRVKIDSSIRKANPVVQQDIKPKESKDSIVAINLDTVTKLQTVKVDYFEHKDGVLTIKESIVHTGEILKFDRYIELDTPYITETITNEILVSPGVKQVERFFEAEIRYPRVLVGAFGQFEDFIGYNAGIGVGYQFKSGAALSFDYLLTDPARTMVRANLYFPLINFKRHGDKVIKPFDPSDFYSK